jgi:hypothetical protein
MLTRLELEFGAAIGTSDLPGARDIKVHLGVGVPGLHVRKRAGAENATLMIKVSGAEFYDGLWHGFPVQRFSPGP